MARWLGIPENWKSTSILRSPRLGKVILKDIRGSFATRKLMNTARDRMFMRSLESRRKETWILVYAARMLKTLSKQTCVILTQKAEILNLALLLPEEQNPFPGCKIGKAQSGLLLSLTCLLFHHPRDANPQKNHEWVHSKEFGLNVQIWIRIIWMNTCCQHSKTADMQAGQRHQCWCSGNFSRR